jgi:hypothetical protein
MTTPVKIRLIGSTGELLVSFDDLAYIADGELTEQILERGPGVAWIELNDPKVSLGLVIEDGDVASAGTTLAHFLANEAALQQELSASSFEDLGYSVRPVEPSDPKAIISDDIDLNNLPELLVGDGDTTTDEE